MCIITLANIKLHVATKCIRISFSLCSMHSNRSCHSRVLCQYYCWTIIVLIIVLILLIQLNKLIDGTWVLFITLIVLIVCLALIACTVIVVLWLSFNSPSCKLSLSAIPSVLPVRRETSPPVLPLLKMPLSACSLLVVYL